jgi:hypothetical protein
MSHPGLDPDLAAAFQVLERVFGPDPDPPQVLSVRPTPPPRRPTTPPPAPAAAGPEQPRLLQLPSAPPPPNRRTL